MTADGRRTPKSPHNLHDISTRPPQAGATITLDDWRPRTGDARGQFHMPLAGAVEVAGRTGQRPGGPGPQGSRAWGLWLGGGQHARANAVLPGDRGTVAAPEAGACRGSFPACRRGQPGDAVVAGPAPPDRR